MCRVMTKGLSTTVYLVSLIESAPFISVTVTEPLQLLEDWFVIVSNCVLRCFHLVHGNNIHAYISRKTLSKRQ